MNILVVCLRRLGDVLLATPLIRSLARAPGVASVDALVFSGTQGVLAGNPDVRHVRTLSAGAGPVESARLAGALWRRYDWALSTQSGDRPTFFARIAGRQAIGFRAEGLAGGARDALLTRALAPDATRHRVEEVLRLLEPLGFAKQAVVSAPAPVDCGEGRPREPYAVLHPGSAMRYKRWPAAAWQELAAWLADRGIAACVTGSADDAERRVIDEAFPPGGAPVRRLDGRLGWGQLTELVQGAAVFAGIDTSMTHLAAATGVPTVALFGPTDPRLWGPWPTGAVASPWVAAAKRQRAGNVWLLQGEEPCVPCQREGCERHRESASRCLDGLAAARVIDAVAEAVGARRTIAIAVAGPSA